MAANLFIFCSLLFYSVCFSSANYTDTKIILASDITIVSEGKTFELGFFSLKEKTYLGIWFYGSKSKSIVWVANRDSPLSSKNGVFAIAEDGNLIVFESILNGTSVWKTDVKQGFPGSRTVKLMDSGNFVLREGNNTDIWQSFDNPTDTFLPGMIMKEGLHGKLSSWSSEDDPSQGNFTFELEMSNQYVIKKKRYPIWKSTGVWENVDLIIPVVKNLLIWNSNSQSRINSMSVGGGNWIDFNSTRRGGSQFDYNHTRLVIQSNGTIEFQRWNMEDEKWDQLWSQGDGCSLLKRCGSFATCNSKSLPLCRCLPGFEPTAKDNWDTGYFYDGCKRKSEITKDLQNIEYPRLLNVTLGKPDLKYDMEKNQSCLSDCKSYDSPCNAYSETIATFRNNATCSIWREDLQNIVQADVSSAVYVLVTRSDIAIQFRQEALTKQRRFHVSPVVIIVLAIAIFIASTCLAFYIHHKRMEEKNRQENIKNNWRDREIQLYDSEKRVKDFIDSGKFREDDRKAIDVPVFDLDTILIATDNFSEENKIGRGGFGVVYKGKFPGGLEIAIKRLSKGSTQGVDEFKNEVILIAKLQHRNLVRLLGYCVAEDETMLLYEYLPNKSLDSFIFDRTLCLILKWDARFNIILGFARGLLYLHEDSRLRVIHRDLKTSNVLLDAHMNPKISDFGLAKIFDGQQTEGATKRVVGTYGYMSPEYAFEGFFSVKSDVFSFGVVVLEIISGKRNTGFYQSEQALSLIGYAWKLWTNKMPLEITDQVLRESCNPNEVIKCINVGLLCVQEDPADRPTMSNVAFMLSNGCDNASLPNPKEPAFVARRSSLSTGASSSSLQPGVDNEISLLEPR